MQSILTKYHHSFLLAEFEDANNLSSSGSSNIQKIHEYANRGGYTTWTITSNGGVLNSKHSAVSLDVPPKAVPPNTLMTVQAKVHLGVRKYKKFIPKRDHIIAPVPEFYLKQGFEILSNNVLCKSTGTLFCHFNEYVVINIPHCVKDKSLWPSIKVYYINTEFDVRAVEIPRKTEPLAAKHIAKCDAFFILKEKSIAVYTSHFTHFICTCSSRLHETQVEAVIFGSYDADSNNNPEERMQLINLRVYLCDILFSITDYRQVSIYICMFFILGPYRLNCIEI